MYIHRVFPAIVLSTLLAACGHHDSDTAPPTSAPPPRFSADITRTTHGVVHVKAADFRSLGYGLAYAYAQDNLCMFADSLLTARGERSQYFGGEARATARKGDEYGAASGFMDLKNEDSDFFFKGYLDIDKLRAGYAAGPQEPRDLLEGYVAGYNRYLKDNAGNYPAACKDAKWVKPVTVEDMYLVLAEKALHASGEVFAKEVVAGARDANATVAVAAKPQRRKLDSAFLLARLDKVVHQGFGSNALAVGKDLSASGRGLLLGNPHFPWTSTDRFYQAHLTVPGRYDVMGVTLGGMPAVVIGFNKDVAWSHTVTAATHFTTFKLALDAGDSTGTTYLVDGEKNKMTSKTVSVDILMADGTTTKRTKTFYFSKQGAVIVKPEAGLTWNSTTAYVLADPNRGNTRMLEQWLGIGTATSVQTLKTSLDAVVGLPWVNTVAADRAGNALYADASVVPHVTTDKFAGNCLLLPALVLFDGSRSACAWGQDANAPAGIFSPANAPAMQRTDYVGNSNDSYWLTNARSLLTGPAPLGYSPLYGKTAVEQRLRTRIGFIQFEELAQQGHKFQLSDLQTLVFADRIYAAELVLPELLAACPANDAILVQACTALAAWDRHANLDSRGAVLFREFWTAASQIPNKWKVPLDPTDPVHTPNGVAPAALPAMFAALKTAAQKLQSLNIPLDARLGDFQGETRNGVRTPLHGGVGDIDGSYNSLRMSTPLTATGYNNVYWGTSYVQTVTFDDAGPVAQAMLVYGQSTDPRSPYYADQLPLYSRKEWPSLPFTEASINADPNRKTVTLTE
ncbi:acyl-homoserine-lactone acylase [Massilia sp. PDC64]|nr:penicillin acylase family protein [Massilia sp. PDC64]SDE66032.1 acyl-homoserine-lactone acylase [Massilia sp. PDC64]